MADAYLYPDGTVTAGGSWTPTGAATIHAAIDDIQGAPDDDTTYVQGSDSTWDYFYCSLGPMVDVVSIESITMHMRYNNAGGGANQEIDFGIRVGSTDYLNGAIAVVSSTYATATKTWTLNPATSAPWTKPQLDDLQIVVGTQDPGGKPVDSVRCTQAFVAVVYQPIPAGIAAAREIASQRLRRYRKPLEECQVDVGLDKLDNELMDDVSITHFAGPHASGLGWGTVNWKRRLHQHREESIDLNRMQMTMSTRGRRGYLCTFWDTSESRRTSNATEDGVSILTTGGTRSFARLSHKYVEDPSSRLVTQLGANQHPIAYQGRLMESSATNYLIHSSCTDGASAVAALTVTGASGTFAQESSATQPLFDSTSSIFNYLFTAGSPHTADKRAAWPATASVLANTITRVSIDYLNSGSVSADRLTWRLQRASDSNYWNDATPAWQAGAVDNPLTLASTRTRAISNRIDVGGSNTTLTFSLAQLSGGTAARTDRVYHVQLEDKAWATSHIVTTTANYTRALETYGITDSSGKRAINSTGGTFLCQVIPEYTAADALAGGVDLYFFSITYDASNWFRFYYDVSAGNLVFEIRAAGTTTSATMAWSPTRGTTYKLCARWTSSAGELDLTARTHSIFLDGVKGTDATRAADPTRAAVTLYMGGDGTGAACNSNITRILFSPEVYTDSEIARFIA